ncbi:hypothetical protein [Rhodococcoides corynebacterioides]|uniref:hypothetical protein n=1 Tax=Rhodococcoides corynebacterioides TaxID=53972 RepID=UPI0011150332|nr:hypothetical protein [Rhodococcus corynebacterioides]
MSDHRNDSENDGRTDGTGSPVSDEPTHTSERPYDSTRDPDADPTELDDAAGNQPDQAEGE